VIDPSLWWDDLTLLRKARDYFRSAKLDGRSLYAARKDVAQARRYYEMSLSKRPINPALRQKLARMGSGGGASRSVPDAQGRGRSPKTPH
jgi:hypothetical protein